MIRVELTYIELIRNISHTKDKRKSESTFYSHGEWNRNPMFGCCVWYFDIRIDDTKRC